MFWKPYRQFVTAIVILCLSSATLAAQALHDVHAGAGVQCTACHEQFPPLPGATTPDSTCIACHGTMLDTASASLPNPHASPHLGPGEVPACTECHKVHEPSEVTCVMCHRGFQFDIK